MHGVFVCPIEVVVFFLSPFAYDFGRDTTDNGKWFYVVGYNCAGSDYSSLPNGDARENNGVAAYPCPSSNGYGGSFTTEMNVIIVVVQCPNDCSISNNGTFFYRKSFSAIK